MTDTSNDTGLDAAAAAIEALLTPDTGDNQTTRSQGRAKAEVDDSDEDDETEALQSEADDETPDDADADDADADADESDDDDGDDEATTTDLDPLTTKVTVQVDGKAAEITLDEAIKGYQRQADYSRKTQALSEERRNLDAERQALREERQQYATLIPALEAQLSQTTTQEPDWAELYHADPQQFAVQRELWRMQQERIHAARSERERLEAISAQERSDQMQTRVQTEREKLFGIVPEWRDTAKWKQARDQIREYGRKIGFSDEELAGATDHRAVVALHKAALYDKLMASNRPTPAKADRASSPPPVKPTARTANAANNDVTKAKQRLKHSGSVADAAALFEKFL